MRIFTEFELREKYRNNPFSSFHLPAGCRLTPAAAQFLSDRKISVEREEAASQAHRPEKEAFGSKDNAGQGYILPDGRVCRDKPEHMTHLRGRELVDKRDPRIRLRGKLDSLQAQIIDTVIEFEMIGHAQAARQLKSLLELARALMRAEVTGEMLPAPSFDGLGSGVIREISHHPEKHLGVKHFLPSPAHGRLMSRLNLLRTAVRETELAAADAFCREDGETERKDIIENLNRMSSMVYIMMCRLLAGDSHASPQ